MAGCLILIRVLLDVCAAARQALLEGDKYNAASGGAFYCLLNVIEMLTKLIRIGGFDFRPNYLETRLLEIKSYPIAVKCSVVID